MKETQRLIDEMHGGNAEIILSNISAKTPILVLNAIMAGIKHGLKESSFIEGIRKAEENEAVLLGVPVCKVATAALHLLNAKPYTGTDRQILELIESKFEWICSTG